MKPFTPQMSPPDEFHRTVQSCNLNSHTTLLLRILVLGIISLELILSTLTKQQQKQLLCSLIPLLYMETWYLTCLFGLCDKNQKCKHLSWCWKVCANRTHAQLFSCTHTQGQLTGSNLECASTVYIILQV